MERISFQKILQSVSSIYAQVNARRNLFSDTPYHLGIACVAARRTEYAYYLIVFRDGAGDGVGGSDGGSQRDMRMIHQYVAARVIREPAPRGKRQRKRGRQEYAREGKQLLKEQK